MKFECHQVEDLEFRWGWSRFFIFLIWSRLFFRLASTTSSYFFWKFSRLKKGACVALKFSQLPSKSSCTLLKPWKRRICVHTELSKRMPFCQCKQKVKYGRIMGFRKKPFKDRDCALSKFFLSNLWAHWKYFTTWRISSKFRAASFFIPETFSPKRRIVDRPKVGISLYRWLSLWTAVSPCTIRIRIKWEKTDFQTPNSNSCIKSTVNIWNKFNPNFDKHINAF